MSIVLGVLNEVRWSGYLYHATSGAFDPKRIKQGSHLGTLKVAIRRGGENYEAGTKVHAYDYRPSGRSVEVEDNWGGLPAKDMIATQLRNRGVISHDEYHNIHHKNPERLDKQGIPLGVSDRKLSSLLKSKGISHLTYANKVEDKGSTSHIIYDPENLHHVHTFDSPAAVLRKAKIYSPKKFW
jgi:hypothetical protein